GSPAAVSGRSSAGVRCGDRCAVDLVHAPRAAGRAVLISGGSPRSPVLIRTTVRSPDATAPLPLDATVWDSKIGRGGSDRMRCVCDRPGALAPMYKTDRFS